MRPGRLIALLGTVVAFGGLGLENASAEPFLTVVPSFPDSVTVGQPNVPVSLTLTNNSTPPDQNTAITLNSSNVTLTPSCGSPLPPPATDPSCPAGSADPDVFSVSASGTGRAGTACAGVPFDISETETTTGYHRFYFPNPIPLTAPGDSCTIDFTVDVLKVPTIDADAGAPGVQTAQLAQAFASSPTPTQPYGSGVDVTTVNEAPTAVTLRSFSASHSRGGIVFRWRTGSELATIGYHVYRQQGRRLVRLNRLLIRSRIGPSSAGQTYSWSSKSAGGCEKPTYRLQAVGRDGSRAWVGSTTAA